MPGQVDRIVFVPRNGLGNRLHAWASAALLARVWNAPLDLLWEPEVAAPTLFKLLFRGLPSFPGVRQSLLDREELDHFLGASHEALPRYVWRDPARHYIVLAGHDRGEQALMGELAAMIDSAETPVTLVIIAGGLFDGAPQSAQRSVAFAAERRDFYASLVWHPAILDRAASAAPAPRYSALHIRLTDRSNEAPTSRAIDSALTAMRSSGFPESLFIAADTAEARSRWSERARRRGFVPWSVIGTDFSRTSQDGGLSAAVDWLLLSRAQAMVFPAASTFSSEAAVASGATSWALSAGPTQQWFRRTRQHVRNVLTYPARALR